MDSHEREHLRHIAAYQRQIERIFDAALKDAARLGLACDAAGMEQLFAIGDHPEVKKQFERLMQKVADNIEAVVADGVTAEWQAANDKNDALAFQLLGQAARHLNEAQRRRYFNNHEAAREAFLRRKEAGLNLSERVWRYTGQFKEEIEMGLDCGLRDGLTAPELARQLKQYLQHPDTLFRRVRDENGLLQLSSRAKAYHPGRGVYRSAYMNARRLAATETNIAYRTADHDRQQDLDFVVGIEVHLSTNHTVKVHTGTKSTTATKPLHDICDELQGRYPKTFKFTGWHPHCRCYTTTILKTPEEIAEDNRRIMRGEEPAKGSEREVRDLPQRFKDWVKDNQERIKGAKQLPYFLKDNKKLISADVSLSAGMSEFKLIGSGKSEIDIVITDELSDYSLPPGVRSRLNEISNLKTYNQFKAYFKEQHGIDFTTDFEDLIQNHADEDIVTVRNMGQKFAAAVESYKEVFGPNSLRKLKRINIFDKGDDVGGQAAYFFNKIGEHDPWAGTIRVSSYNLDGYSIFHELAHVMQDSVALRGEDAITCAERLVKTARLNPKMKAYFGASSEAMEAERMADAFGYGFGRGRKMGIDFIRNVWQEVRNSGMHMERDRVKPLRGVKANAQTIKKAIANATPHHKDWYKDVNSPIEKYLKEVEYAIVNGQGVSRANNGLVVLFKTVETDLSLYQQKALLTHELTHLLMEQKRLFNVNAITVPMSKLRAALSNVENGRVRGVVLTETLAQRSITTRAELLTASTRQLKASLADMEAQIIKAEDTLMSLNAEWGKGHSVTYFTRKHNAQGEFLAHCAECFYHGNPIMEELMPDIYKQMIRTFKDVLRLLDA